MQATIEEPRLCGDDVLEIAKQVREQWHQELAGAAIVYVFKPRGTVKHGKVTLGTAKKQSAVAKVVSEADFVVTLSYDQWVHLSAEQRVALIDHELCHCKPKLDKEGTRTGWTSRKHDLEEFCCVVERHGLVFADQREFALTVRQLPLPFDEAAEGEAAGD